MFPVVVFLIGLFPSQFAVKTKVELDELCLVDFPFLSVTSHLEISVVFCKNSVDNYKERKYTDFIRAYF